MCGFSLRPGGIFIRVCFLLAAAIAGGRAEAQSAPGRTVFPDFTPDPKAYEYGQRGQRGVYSWWDLAEIGLWASGASLNGESTAAGNRRRPSFGELIRGTAEELRNDPDLPPEPRERGEYILSFMHKRLLKSYSEHQTRLDTLLTDGRYNCVSSAVLYMILAASAGLNVEGVMTRDHAFVTVLAGREYIDVETTNPYGFDPGSRREFHDGFGRLTGFAYVPARNYRDRSDITQLELISLIMSNRIADLESRNRFSEAVPLAANRMALLSTRTKNADSPFFTDPEKDLVDRLFNYGSSLLRTGKEEDALLWADIAGAGYPGEKRWQEFRYAAMNNILVKLLRNRQTEEARKILHQNMSRLSSGHFAVLDTLVLDAELTRLTTEIRTVREAESALEIINSIQPRSPLPEGRKEELRTFALLKEGEFLAGEKGWREAAVFIETAISQYGSNPRLENSLRVFRTNRVTELHNTFAGLYNQGRYDEARSFIRAALQEFPGNRQLTTDQRMAEQAK
jgi:tetratricopeptide (TPR) repeat protein